MASVLSPLEGRRPDKRHPKYLSPLSKIPLAGMEEAEDGGENHEDMQFYLPFDKASCFGIKIAFRT
jgi:hypothetical protein